MRQIKPKRIEIEPNGTISLVSTKKIVSKNNFLKHFPSFFPLKFYIGDDLKKEPLRCIYVDDNSMWEVAELNRLKVKGMFTAELNNKGEVVKIFPSFKSAQESNCTSNEKVLDTTVEYHPFILGWRFYIIREYFKGNDHSLNVFLVFSDLDQVRLLPLPNTHHDGRLCLNVTEGFMTMERATKLVQESIYNSDLFDNNQAENCKKLFECNYNFNQKYAYETEEKNSYYGNCHDILSCTKPADTELVKYIYSFAKDYSNDNKTKDKQQNQFRISKNIRVPY